MRACDGAGDSNEPDFNRANIWDSLDEEREANRFDPTFDLDQDDLEDDVFDADALDGGLFDDVEPEAVWG